ALMELVDGGVALGPRAEEGGARVERRSLAVRLADDLLVAIFRAAGARSRAKPAADAVEQRRLRLLTHLCVLRVRARREMVVPVRTCRPSFDSGLRQLYHPRAMGQQARGRPAAAPPAILASFLLLLLPGIFCAA